MARFFILCPWCSPLYNGQTQEGFWSVRDRGGGSSLTFRAHTHWHSVLWAHCGSAECWQTNFKLDLLPIDDEMQTLSSACPPAEKSAEQRNWRYGCAACAFLNETLPAETDVWTAVDGGILPARSRFWWARNLPANASMDIVWSAWRAFWNCCTEIDAI